MHTKDYLNNEIKEEIEKKGFSIYNYISLKELLLTVNKDYLTIINNLNTAFLLLIFLYFLPLQFIINNPLDYILSFTLLIYSLIFIYLILKLLFRTYKFSQITNILYTKKGLVIKNKIFHYEEDEKLKNLLLDYEKLFDEYLSKPSKLSENINILQTNISNDFKKYSEGKKIGDVLFTQILYIITIYIFYYVGFILGFFIFFIFSFFIDLYFKINKSVELKIKDEMTIVDDRLKKLDEIYILLNKKINSFQDGEISNLSSKIDKDMNTFYENINTILSH
uniref:hypothetical protein n=1 Tax=Aliarcobacter butzleri TaxID=28197 RepID=UPI00191A724B